MKPKRHPQSITTAVMAEAAEYDNRLKIASNQIPESPVRTTNSFSKKLRSATWMVPRIDAVKILGSA